MKRRNEHFRKHVKNIQKETRNSIILSDVAGNPPEHQTKQEDEQLFTPVEKVAGNNVDGKTWDTDK